MGDYISREAAYQFFKDQLEEETGAFSKGRNAGLRVAMSAVMNNDAIPAADVRPVVLGEWVNDHNGKYSASGDNFYCSICKDPSLRAFGKPAKTNYCPNCGAEMRIFSTNCKNTVTTGEDREIRNLRAWLKNGQENKTK